MPYKLSASLRAHTADVRAVASPTDDLVLSASRDSTAITWSRASNASFTQNTTLHAGSRYINAVTYLPPTPDAPAGYAVTGGQDTVINIFSLSSGSAEPSFSLIGHTENVCALHAAPDGTIISGSWDQSAKVWRDFKLAYDLRGHQQSVWAVLAIDGRTFLTGSADNTVKLWNQHKNVRTYPGHTQAVRGLALITDIGFASCSNDSEIRIWTMEGDTVYTLSGHTSFVYSLSVLSTGEIISGGEDRTVRVWKDGECVQTIVHPAISVWSVSTMPNGDIVSGCSDGVVRVFSASEERWAPADKLKEYEEQLASQAVPMQQVGDVNKDDLPGPEALTQPGKKSGEVKMIRRGEIVEAHQWDTATLSWQKIGDVVDAVGSGRKQLYNGKEYDYVFDVDVQEGAPPLKLPYNANENPYTAAQRFLEANELPMTYLDEVVKFVEKNTASVNIGPTNTQFVDPYTGASRYQAGQSSGAGRSTEYMDPFTGAARYRAPQSASSPAPAASTNFSDPFTGANRYSGAPPAQTQPAQTVSRPKVLPVRSTVSFRSANVSAMRSKLLQYDDVLRNEISTSSLSMYPEESRLIDECFNYLTQAVASATPPQPPLTPAHVDAVCQLLERWPAEAIFPVMDLSRLIIAFCPASYVDPTLRTRFLAAMLRAAEWSEPWSVPQPKQRETNVLFLLRGIANGLQDDTPLEGISLRGVDALGEAPYEVLTKNQRVALATALFNLSCMGLRHSLDATLVSKVLLLARQVLLTEKTDSEAAYRALVALGNLVYAAKEQKRPFDAAQKNEIRQSIAGLPALFPEDRIRDVKAEVEALL